MSNTTSIDKEYPLYKDNNDFKETDMKKILTDEGIDEDNIDNILITWNKKPRFAFTNAEILFDEKWLSEALKSKNEAHTYFSQNELYINNTLSSKISSLFNILIDLYNDEDMRIFNLKNYTDYNYSKEYKLINNILSNNELIKSVLFDIKHEMRKELSIGDYVTNNTSNEEKSS